MTSHLHEPKPGSGLEEQEHAFVKLRADVQKKTELISQYDSAVSGKSNLNSWFEDQGSGTSADAQDDEEWQQPPADDILGNAIYAVYSKGYRKGKEVPTRICKIRRPGK